MMYLKLRLLIYRGFFVLKFNFYNVFLNKVKINVYKDKCPTYVKSTQKPRLWEPGMPTNIDVYGNKSYKIIGIDPSKFISKRENKDDPIILLTE